MDAPLNSFRTTPPEHFRGVVIVFFKEVIAMTLQLAIGCLVAALLAVGASVLCVRAGLPSWLCEIVKLAVLLLAFVWVQRVL